MLLKTLMAYQLQNEHHIHICVLVTFLAAHFSLLIVADNLFYSSLRILFY